ncbi:MAG TPA: transposase family protein [Candidatus Methylomirabilis sp.]|nr:transposase family protein [Candidatus Methylomirabilis sp.]
MSRQGRWEYLKAIYPRYQQASRIEKQRILDEFCRVTGYHRKSALRLLNGPPPARRPPVPRRRPPTYGTRVIQVLAAIWRAAGYPWSVRLKALLPLWLPWARPRFRLTAALEAQLLRLSPRQMDRRLAGYRRPSQTGRFGRTKPGTLLKHHIPLRTDRWDVTVPGFTEIDLVAHCGEAGDGEFAHSLNLTDIHTTWVETRAILGRGQQAVQQALEAMRQTLPFRLQGIDSDNGSEFINAHLVAYCQRHGIQFTRGRPYKKDDNAHIEQKNWTHVRKLLGYVRYDSPAAVAVMNALYRQELRLFQNLFLPSVKLVRKTRVGARIRRVYDRPQTPFERVQACPEADPLRVAHLRHLRATLDPFVLAETIDQHLSRLYALAHHRAVPPPPARGQQADLPPASHRHKETRSSSGSPRTADSRSGAVPVRASRPSRVTSPMARRTGGK